MSITKTDEQILEEIRLLEEERRMYEKELSASDFRSLLRYMEDSKYE